MGSPWFQVHSYLLSERELLVVGPNLLAGSAEQLEYLVQLVLLALAAEQRRHVDEFSKDAADRPDVDVRRVLLLPEQELGGSVPECDDNGRVVLQGRPVLSRQAEVSHLQDAAVAQEDVGRLEISEKGDN